MSKQAKNAWVEQMDWAWYLLTGPGYGTLELVAIRKRRIKLVLRLPSTTAETSMILSLPERRHFVSPQGNPPKVLLCSFSLQVWQATKPRWQFDAEIASLMTVWWHFEDSSMTVLWLFGDSLRTVWWFFGDSLMTVWWRTDDRVMTAWCQIDDSLITSWWQFYVILFTIW